MKALHRSFWMLSGGFVIIFIFMDLIAYTGNFILIFLSALRNSVSPISAPCYPAYSFLQYGMPSAGTAAGTIVGAVELSNSVNQWPICVLMKI